MTARDIPWETLSRQAAIDFGVTVVILPVWVASWTDQKGERKQRFFTGDQDDLIKWLDDLRLPFVKVERAS